MKRREAVEGELLMNIRYTGWARGWGHSLIDRELADENIARDPDWPQWQTQYGVIDDFDNHSVNIRWLAKINANGRYKVSLDVSVQELVSLLRPHVSDLTPDQLSSLFEISKPGV